MKKRTVILYTTAVALAVAVWLCWLPRAVKIDRVVPAMEYSLGDPDYAVEHTVTIQGTDARNVLGKGEFEGTFSVSGIDTGDFQRAHVTFPVPAGCHNVSYAEPNGYCIPQAIFSLTADRDWEYFVGLLMEYEQKGDRLSGTFSIHDCRFLVSGTLPRKEAIARAKELAAGTSLEVVFTDH